MKKRTLLMTLTLLAAAAGLSAQTSGDVRRSRSYTTLGVSYTKGADSPWETPLEAAGFISRSFTFFDAGSPAGGWYWGFGATVGGRAGDVGIADVWAGTLGWMGNPFASPDGPSDFDWELNASLSPVLGTRTLGNKTIAGSGYLGAGLSLGLSVDLPELPLVGAGALGLTWDPVVPLGRVFDSPQVANQGYMNFGLTWTQKLNLETRTLPWKARG